MAAGQAVVGLFLPTDSPVLFNDADARYVACLLRAGLCGGTDYLDLWRAPVFFLLPLVFAVDLQSGGVHHHKAARRQRLAQSTWRGSSMARLEMLLQ